jgi:autotransporter-associated beta strand protein
LSNFSNSIASMADGAGGGGAVQNGSASGTATLTLTGAKGGTTSFSGELRDGSGGEGGLGGPVLAIIKNGGGTQILAGTNHYTGTTTVNGGVLEVDGSIAPSSMTTVNASATLTGTGTVGNTQINSSGMFAAGNGTPGSSMTVSGSLAFQSGAMYLVMLNPATSSFADVTRTATLGGATVSASYANGSYVSKRYTILTAGSVNGTFGPLVNTNLPANFSTSLSYDPTHAYLDLALNFTPSGPNFGGGLNINQQNVANALTNFFNSTGGIPLVFGTLTPAGLTQASGELATASQQTTFDAMNLFLGLLTDPFVAGRGDGVSAGGGGATGYADADALGYAGKRKPNDALAAIYTKAPPAVPFVQRWSTWVAGYGGSQTTDGNSVLGSNNTTSSVYGTAVGADYRFSPSTLAGFALAGGGTNFSVANSGSGHSDLFQAGAFIRHDAGPAYISAALAYGWQDITTNRFVTVAGADQLRAEFNANAYSGRLGRLSVCRAMDGWHRHHALCRGPVHHLRSAWLCRASAVRRQHVRARLWRQGRHRYPQRTRHPHRQILCDAKWHSDAARPARLGPRLRSQSLDRRHLPDAARRIVRRERRVPGQRIRAHHRFRRNEMEQRLVRRGDL